MRPLAFGAPAAGMRPDPFNAFIRAEPDGLAAGVDGTLPLAPRPFIRWDLLFLDLTASSVCAMCGLPVEPLIDL